MSGQRILSRMNKIYGSEFKIVLDDFSKNVLLKNSDTSVIFLNFIKRINKKCLKSLNKINRVYYSYSNPDAF
jgi:outer membrane lipoprotein SlyB